MNGYWIAGGMIVVGAIALGWCLSYYIGRKLGDW